MIRRTNGCWDISKGYAPPKKKKVSNNRTYLILLVISFLILESSTLTFRKSENKNKHTCFFQDLARNPEVFLGQSIVKQQQPPPRIWVGRICFFGVVSGGKFPSLEPGNFVKEKTTKTREPGGFPPQPCSDWDNKSRMGKWLPADSASLRMRYLGSEVDSNQKEVGLRKNSCRFWKKNVFLGGAKSSWILVWYSKKKVKKQKQRNMMLQSMLFLKKNEDLWERKCDPLETSVRFRIQNPWFQPCHQTLWIMDININSLRSMETCQTCHTKNLKQNDTQQPMLQKADDALTQVQRDVIVNEIAAKQTWSKQPLMYPAWKKDHYFKRQGIVFQSAIFSGDVLLFRGGIPFDL